MSVHEKTTPAGTKRYVVRWRESGRNRSRAFTRRRDAEAYDAEVQRRQQLGAIAVQQLDTGKQTLDEYVARTWGPMHLPTVTPKTRAHYVGTYDRHIGPYLGGVALRDLRGTTIGTWQAQRLGDGAGARAMQQAMTMLGAILRSAAADELIATNPVPFVTKAKVPRARVVEPLAPATIERMRSALLDGTTDKRGRRLGLSRTPLRDATLMAVLAYAGLRPGEALALRWKDVREGTLLVERALSLGEEKGTKTGQARSVTLLDPLRLDLAEWRMASGRPAGDSLVFPTADGEAWQEHDWQNWRRRIFGKAARAAGVVKSHPYALRHSFASLLLHEGQNVVEVAEELGHSAAMTTRVYAHVMKELKGQPKVSAEDAIRAARGEGVPSQFPRAARASA